ncbi:4-hydroxyproline epimerase [Alicyclobacillus fastidiosus]|uniref:4-hydroxyproline epimerase n=1 Tax=Alicyclobacillus fastidiosus TaxID=392011 RepID=A0ABY6ZC70_9BACL|nr:4-hydroxyproline epimerase [Alicyclobacillus fastidiosus]WAH40493.1 4-hydroxyproline epimerase [Alicyclobacillus fastidiosus]GMA61909.1 proline racemase [Alicyclobacillus fastidiosus]
MKFSKLVTTIDTHTGGNPTRTVTSGAPELIGQTMTEKMVYMKEHHDDFRRALMYEPRGHEVMSGCILTAPCNPNADIGVVYIETGGYLPMCGHDTIGVCTALIEGGIFPSDKTTLRLDTPAGLVEAKLTIRDGKVEGVTFTNIPSFLYKKDIVVDVAGVGSLTLDIAYGGNFYGLVDASTIGLALSADNGSNIVQLAVQIREAVNRTVDVVHPEIPVIQGMTHVEFYGEPMSQMAHCRNVVVVPPGGIDRSPCGTGTSAKVATLFAKGELAIGEEFVHESIVGSVFYAKVLEETTVGHLPAIVPQVSGAAWVTGFHQFLLHDSDPLNDGFLLI